MQKLPIDLIFVGLIKGRKAVQALFTLVSQHECGQSLSCIGAFYPIANLAKLLGQFRQLKCGPKL